MTGTVTVLITNTYMCGRESEATEKVTAPPPGAHPDSEELGQWFGDYVHDLTGDGHPCGERENAYYDAEIIEAPGRPDLVGESYSWEG